MTGAEPATSLRGVDLSDEEIVARVKRGDLACYEILMRRHNQQVYRAVRSILRNESEVEDVLQEAYLSAYHHLAGFEARSRFSTWLVRIAVNAALDRRRRRARLVALDPEAQEGLLERSGPGGGSGEGGSPEDQSARRELARLLERAIDALPEAFRSVYVLREIEQLSTQETAESLGLEPGTVKTRLHRARALLRRWLIEDLDATTLEAFPFGAARCDRLVDAVLGRLARSHAEAMPTPQSL